MSARSKLLDSVGAIPDLMFMGIADTLVRRSDFDGETYLRRIAFYDPERWGEGGGSFLYLPEGPPGAETLEERLFLSGKRTLFSYPSRYRPRNPEVAEGFYSCRENLTGYLHLWHHESPGGRPLVLAIHGLMMGGPAKARRMFKIDRLFALGLDVALHTLPGHWRRSSNLWFQQLLDPADLPLTLERLAQNVHDLHSALLLLREMGYRRIGIIGASMGGFTAALYATQVANGLDLMFLALPAVSVEHYLKPRPGRFDFPVDESLIRASKRAQELCSPLYLRPRFDVGKMRVVAHAGDRVCDVRDTRRWIGAWGIDDYREVVGGHFLYLGGDVRGEAWYGLLKERGYVE